MALSPCYGFVTRLHQFNVNRGAATGVASSAGTVEIVRHDFDPFGPGLAYHVTQHATGKEVFFLDDDDRLGLEWTLGRTLERHRAELIDYCWMSNHIHLLLLLRIPNLRRLMQYLMARHVARFNNRHDRRGHLVQAPYHAEPVLTEGQYLEARRYIAMNPVKAGICARPEDWPWSGYGGRGRLVPPPELVLRRMVAQAIEEFEAQRARGPLKASAMS